MSDPLRPASDYKSNWAKSAGSGATAIVFAISFLIAVSAVFFGFIGYYSRVGLATELRQNKDGSSVDLLFMSVEQIEKDEARLSSLRKEQILLDETLTKETNEVRKEAFASKEFTSYFNSRESLLAFFNTNRIILDEEYLKKVSSTLLKSSTDAYDADLTLWSAPIFLDTVTNDQKGALYKDFTPLTAAMSRAYQGYNAKFLQQLYTIDLRGQRLRQPITTEVKAIFSRNPLLATADDRKIFLDIEQPDKEARQRLAQQRALIRSFDNLFVGEVRRVLQWPTIASTILVTLATGWLGGLVNFMGAAVRPRPNSQPLTVEMLSIGSLLRRSFLGVTAALGVFLAAGSGLLILTTQSSSAAGAGAIELSPYFVAFLAFISGFLADDAFRRLATAGRKLFETSDENKQPYDDVDKKSLPTNTETMGTTNVEKSKKDVDEVSQSTKADSKGTASLEKGNDDTGKDPLAVTTEASGTVQEGALKQDTKTVLPPTQSSTNGTTDVEKATEDAAKESPSAKPSTSAIMQEGKSTKDVDKVSQAPNADPSR